MPRLWDSLWVRIASLVIIAVTVSQCVSMQVIQWRAADSMARVQREAQEEHALALVEALGNQWQRIERSGLNPSMLADLVRDRGLVGAWIAHVPAQELAGTEVNDLTQRLKRASSALADARLKAQYFPYEELVAKNQPGNAELLKTQSQGIQLGQVYLAVQLPDARWLNFVLEPAPRGIPPSWPILLFSLLAWLMLAGASGLLANRLARPFRELARSSKALAAGQRLAPIPLNGPRELREVLTAFNAMSARIQSVLTSQRSLLIAIGHDLRTPITALRVRTELIGDDIERERMTRSVDELQRLTEAAVDAGRDLFLDEPHVPIDLTALVGAICADLIDLDLEVVFLETAVSPVVMGWPAELRRAIVNVIDNAQRYGKQARVSVVVEDNVAIVRVEDQGPGIPEDKLGTVLEPLVRLEPSRSQRTGGYGLGLHIVRSIVEAHGGSLSLKNVQVGGIGIGGLRVELCFDRRFE